MNVLWYYSVKGNCSAPLSWSQLREAAKKGDFGPDDFVWTAGYGKEWKKASSIGQLFPPASKSPVPAAESPSSQEIPLPQNNAKETNGPVLANPSQMGEKSVEGMMKRRIARFLRQPSPFEPPKGVPLAALRHVGLPALFAQAWKAMVFLLFKNFSFGRFLIIAGAVFLNILGSSPIVSFGELRPEDLQVYRNRFELAGIMDSSFFSNLSANLRSYRQDPQAFLQNLQTNRESILQSFLKDFHELSFSVADWFAGMNLARAGFLLAIAFGILLSCYLTSWFLSRGWTLLVTRIYRPADRFPDSFLLSQPAASVIQKGFFFVTLFFYLARIGLFGIAFLCAARTPAGTDLSQHSLTVWFSAFLALELFRGFLISWIRDFTTPRIMLLGIGFRKGLLLSLKDFGLWFFGYIILIGFLSTLYLQLIFAFLPEIVDFPILLALFLPPVFLLRALFALNLIFRRRPELRRLTPASPIQIQVNGDPSGNSAP